MKNKQSKQEFIGYCLLVITMAILLVTPYSDNIARIVIHSISFILLVVAVIRMYFIYIKSVNQKE